jgi:hypothetical protein
MDSPDTLIHILSFLDWNSILNLNLVKKDYIESFWIYKVNLFHPLFLNLEAPNWRLRYIYILAIYDVNPYSNKFLSLELCVKRAIKKNRIDLYDTFKINMTKRRFNEFLSISCLLEEDMMFFKIVNENLRLKPSRKQIIPYALRGNHKSIISFLDGELESRNRSIMSRDFNLGIAGLFSYHRTMEYYQGQFQVGHLELPKEQSHILDFLSRKNIGINMLIKYPQPHLLPIILECLEKERHPEYMLSRALEGSDTDVLFLVYDFVSKKEQIRFYLFSSAKEDNFPFLRKCCGY